MTQSTRPTKACTVCGGAEFESCGRYVRVHAADGIFVIRFVCRRCYWEMGWLRRGATARVSVVIALTLFVAALVQLGIFWLLN
jgi:hypothetical protein